MKIGLYASVALALIVFIGAVTYTFNPNHFIVEILGINFNLPIAAWIVIPMFFLFLYTVIHMLVFGLRNYFKLKKWEKDTETLEDALYWSLLNEPKEQKYSMNEIESPAVLLNKASLSISDNVEGLSPRLAKVVNLIQKIKSGEYVNLKDEKMTKVFKQGNPILIKNRLNCLESDDKFVEGVMKANSDYSQEVQKEALRIFARKTNFELARKYIKVFDVENFLVMLNRVNQEDDMGLNKEILTDFVKGLKLSCSDFISIAQVTKKYFRPDENLALFKEYQKENNRAQNAYLYLLFEYELIEQVGQYLDEQEEDEFMKFRAFYYLKNEHSKYKLEDIIDLHSVCNETRFL